jgi:ATP-dependent DNA helicase PIF1
MKQTQALSVMLSGQSVFLTGPPGAGKTYILNEFVRRAKNQGKTVAVTASTGIAATHIGGVTIHSWSGLGVKEFIDSRTRQQMAGNAKLSKRYNSTDILVIDEVSMLHGHRLDMVNEACKLLRKSERPFGGLQVILVGDLFQLPPVNRGGEAPDFVHLSAAWQELNPQICYLSEQHRIRSDGLLDLLEAMRRGELETYHEELLQGRIGTRANEGQAITRLYAHNVDIDTVNQRHLAALAQEIHEYEMETKGGAVKVEQLQRSVLAPELLELKIGAEVMFVANNPQAGFVNGTRGQVVEFQESKPVVRLHKSSRRIKVEPHSWKLEEDGKVRAEVMQLPLRLAWAITIHKSQGMSLDAAEIDLSKSFTPGMGYVALSRVRSLDGLFLSGINAMAMRLHPAIYELDRTLKSLSADLASVTSEAEEETEAEQSVNQIDEGLLTKLRQWRTERSKAEGMPAYIIAHDTLLETIATKKPQTESQLLAINGMGPAKLAKYGPEILKVTTV